MATRTNEQIVREWVEDGMNARDLSLIDRYYAPEYRFTAPGLEVVGQEAMKGFVSAWYSGFPDVRFRLVESVAAGDTVAWHMIISGTHQGEMFGIPATGRSINVEVMVITRFVDGTWTEDHVVFDQLGMLQ